MTTPSSPTLLICSALLVYLQCSCVRAPGSHSCVRYCSTAEGWGMGNAVWQLAPLSLQFLTSNTAAVFLVLGFLFYFTQKQLELVQFLQHLYTSVCYRSRDRINIIVDAILVRILLLLVISWSALMRSVTLTIWTRDTIFTKLCVHRFTYFCIKVM